MKKTLALAFALLMFAPFVFSQELPATLIMGGVPGDKLVYPTSVCCDKLGNFYVFCKETKEILVFSKEFKFKFRFGGFESELVFPKDLAIVRDNMVVSDEKCLLVFDLSGNFKKKLTKLGEHNLVRPCGLSVDFRNRLYVSDPELGKVLITEPDFTVWKAIENLSKPIQCFLLQNGNYIILDKGIKKIVMLSSFFAKIKNFGDLKDPKALQTDLNKLIYVLDEGKLQVFAMDTKPMGSFSFAPFTTFGPYPAMALLEGSIFFADYNEQQLVKINESGKVSSLLQHETNTLCMPSGIAVDENGRIYISDFGNNLIRVLDQKGNQLFSIDYKAPGRLACQKDLLAVCAKGKVSLHRRDGGQIAEIQLEGPLDCDFAPDGSLLVLFDSGKVVKYNGTREVGVVVEAIEFRPTALSCSETHFAVAVESAPRVAVFGYDGAEYSVIELSKKVNDLLLLSPQRVVLLDDEGFSLLDQHSQVMKRFGGPGGPRSSQKPSSDPIVYSEFLPKFTQPLACARFGGWLYCMDRIGMRVVKFQKENLLAPPKVNIMPESLDFGVVVPDTSSERELVVQNLGGDILEGYFTFVPKWISINPKSVRGEDVVIKIKANALHFMPKSVYLEPLVLETNAGRFEVPCRLSTPESLPKQINIALTIGSRFAQVGAKTIDLEVPPYIDDGTTMVPLRFISEAMLGKVEFESGIIDVSFPQSKIYVSMTVGQTGAIVEVDGQPKTVALKKPPIVKSGKTFVPLRFFADTLSCEVYTNDQTKQIRIVYTP